MAELNCFDDRTIDRVRSKYTNGKRGSGDDPIASHAKVAQDVMLGHLERLIGRAENTAYDTAAGLQGEIDGEALIDPELSYDENAARIKSKFGVDFRTYERDKRLAERKDVDEKVVRHARETLRDNFEAIDAGEKDDLVADIREEFGEGFVEILLSQIRSQRESAAEHWENPDPIEPDAEPEPAEPVEAVEPEPAAEPEPETPAEPKTPAEPETPAEPIRTTKPAESRDYSGITGTIRLMADYVRASFVAGHNEIVTTETEAKQQTLEAY